MAINRITDKDYQASLNLATDAEYIQALDANNNPIRIKKSDLATVLAGLIGFDSTVIKNQSPSNGSGYESEEAMDNLFEAGVYGGEFKLPQYKNYQWGRLIVTSGVYYTQVFFNQEMFMFRFNSSSNRNSTKWSQWREVMLK